MIRPLLSVFAILTMTPLKAADDVSGAPFSSHRLSAGASLHPEESAAAPGPLATHVQRRTPSMLALKIETIDPLFRLLKKFGGKDEQNLEKLSVLRADETTMQDHEPKILGHALRSGRFPTLSHLSLSRVQVTDAGMTALWRCVIERENPLSICSLSLGSMGVAGMAALADAMTNLPNLTYLGLKWVEDAGMAALQQAVKQPKLQSVYISDISKMPHGYEILQASMRTDGYTENLERPGEWTKK